jgi:hypothetical protein
MVNLMDKSPIEGHFSALYIPTNSILGEDAVKDVAHSAQFCMKLTLLAVCHTSGPGVCGEGTGVIPPYCFSVIVMPPTPAVNLTPCWTDWRSMTTPC